ncbi:MarR family transcriptional regulator [Rhodococcus sp. BUPNP1]|uniref:MarR family winged helix-turn-helix transcriptional regulator n=1 Tax=Rhodococcus sp. BUPNP1 TaxID=1432786 RepID=UPI000B5A915F|nr:MarR family transcriptional regulator [Rhodococcus sp. BUPNP1]OWY83813.1 MarR family transcriptional regulator [Rhodococcus sp. BUPNP1]
MTDDARLDMIHRLRALTVQLDLLGAEFAQKHALHPTDLRALIGLLDRERAGEIATPGWLAEHLRLNTASVTALVDRLERAGHVRRDRDSDDRRRVILHVTPAAEKLGWDFFGPLFTRASTALESFSEPQLEVVREFLGSMTVAVESARSPEDT